jgi:hypothetical protein
VATTYDPFGVGRGDCDRGNCWDGSKALEPMISLPNYLAPMNWGIITLNLMPSAAPARTWIITISSAIVFSRFQTPIMPEPQRPTQRRSADQRPAHELAKPVPCHVPVPELADNCPLPLAL